MCSSRKRKKIIKNKKLYFEYEKNGCKIITAAVFVLVWKVIYFCMLYCVRKLKEVINPFLTHISIIGIVKKSKVFVNTFSIRYTDAYFSYFFTEELYISGNAAICPHLRTCIAEALLTLRLKRKEESNV